MPAQSAGPLLTAVLELSKPIKQCECQPCTCEHTFFNFVLQELLVLYRETQSDPSGGGVSKLKQRVLGPSPDDLTPKFQQRNPIVMRIYRDIPVPSWKVVFPNKLLQFRPLDGLRSDLLSLAGVICESLLLDGARGSHVRASLCVTRVPAVLRVGVHM